MKHQSAEAWVEEGRASRLPDAISDAFDEHVHALPWAGTTGLDWSQLPPSREINLSQAGPDQVVEWACTTALGRHTHLAVWYSREEGGIVVPLGEGIAAIDELYFDAPGPRFSFGIDVQGEVLKPTFQSLLQYGYGDVLIATS